MTAPTALIPGKPVPALILKTVSGADWSAVGVPGDNFAILVFYRGFHCPKCKQQLLELQEHVADFQKRGTSITAISMDPLDRAERSRDEWDVKEIDLAYGLTAAQARAWGLHMSSSRGMTSAGVEELKVFNEPGLFLVRPDGTLYASWVQTVPFARPQAADLLSMIDFVLDKDYPPRGTLEAA